MRLEHDEDDIARLEKARSEHRQAEAAAHPSAPKPANNQPPQAQFDAEPAKRPELPPTPRDELAHGDTIYIDQDGNLQETPDNEIPLNK